jgi:hypothetical protein
MDQNEISDEFLTEVLERVVDVEPSPESFARVRQIASERVSRRWGFLTVNAAGGVLVALTLLVTAMWLLRGRQDVTSAMRHDSAAGVIQAKPIAIPLSMERRQAARNRAVPREMKPPAASVIVPNNELAAIRRWMATARAGEFAFELAADAVPVSQELAIPESISLPAISLTPIGPDDSSE